MDEGDLFEQGLLLFFGNRVLEVEKESRSELLLAAKNTPKCSHLRKTQWTGGDRGPYLLELSGDASRTKELLGWSFFKGNSGKELLRSHMTIKFALRFLTTLALKSAHKAKKGNYYPFLPIPHSLVRIRKTQGIALRESLLQLLCSR